MLNKTKKVAFLTSGLAGALVVSSAAGVALSSCTTTNTSNNTDSSDKYTYAIDWTDQDQVKQLTIDEQGLVYSSASKTEIIAVAPNTAATSVVIPASVRYITGYNEITKNSDGTVATSTTKGAFQGLVSLISVTFASDTTLVSIGDSAFSGCTYLSTISLPSSTSVVYNNAFLNCTNLRSINLVGVSYIGSSAFQNAMANGAGVSIDLSSASYIGDNAFNGCTSLVKADFSSNTTLSYIGVSAFNGAFVNGDSATTLDLSKATTLKTISDSAFAGCTNLTSVVLPSSGALTTIGANAFSGASNLTQVGSATGTFTAPSSLGNYATSTVSSTTYVSSGIGANAFSGTKIATIDLSAVTATTPLGNAAFKGMTALTSVNFGSTKITTIPYSLFENDTALTTLTLPSSITTIQNGAYNTSTSSGTDTTDYTNQRSPFYNSGLKTVDMSAITSYATGTTTWYGVTIDNTTAVPNALFQNLTTLTSVVLKKGTVVIGSDAFNGASALTSVKEGSTSTAADATDGLVIPTTLEMINTAAFQGTGIKSVAFASASSNSLWFIGKDVFKSTTALETVDLSAADTTTQHSTQSGAIYDTAQTAVTVTGLSVISTGAFSGATALKTINLPSSITNIYSSAFVNNTALTSVNFTNLTKLADIASTNFKGASALKTIDLSQNTAFTTIKTATAIFTGLPEGATVSLPSIATTLAATSFLIGDNTTASTSARPAIKYPNSLTLTTVTEANKKVIGSTKSSTASQNPMLQYVSNDFDLASNDGGSDIQAYYPRTFFGNTSLKELTLSAASLYTAASGGSSSTPTQQEILFVHLKAKNTISTTYYNEQYLPFGGNSALTNLVFSNFTLNDNPTWPKNGNTNETSNSLYRTTSTTWAQVATIINKFASNSINAPAKWPNMTTSGNTDATSKINMDSTITSTPNTTSSSGSYTLTFSESIKDKETTVGNAALSINNTISASTSSEVKFVHNGVTWTLTVESGGAITLVGENINVYKATTPNSNSYSDLNPYQICFNQGTNGTPSKITVTLNIYTPSSN